MTDNSEKTKESRKNNICIVIPVYKYIINNDEYLSLKSCLFTLKNYQIIFIAPDSMRYSRPSYLKDKDIIYYFCNKYFKNLRSYNLLLLSKSFYLRFIDYRFMLIYQLDALAFRDDLQLWADAGLSYVGAPWVAKKSEALDVVAVGNGGLSFRDIQAHLRVLDSCDLKIRKILTYKGIKHAHIMTLLGLFWMLRKIGIRYRYGSILARFGRLHEDVFWGMYAQNFDCGFKTADVKTALRFSFDRYPEICLQRAGGKLPFGCHAWPLYKDFWRQALAENAQSIDWKEGLP